MSAKDEAQELDKLWADFCDLARQCDFPYEGLSMQSALRVGATNYARAAIRAALAEALAQEWAVLDGPEFDYTKLSAEQENLYCYAFNTGSKAAGEQMVAEARAPLVEILQNAVSCPSCWIIKGQPHDPDCPVAAALAKETP